MSGIPLAVLVDMNIATRSAQQRDEPVLRWIFERNEMSLTCEVDATGGHRYDVCVIPHWDVSQGVVEKFYAPRAAFERHAEIARQLRAGGWMVRGRGKAPGIAA